MITQNITPLITCSTHTGMFTNKQYLGTLGGVSGGGLGGVGLSGGGDDGWFVG